MQAIFTLATFLLFVICCRAIEVTSNSNCYSTCGGGLTFGTDLTCNDDGYNNTDVGRKMDACLTCESTSTASLPSDGNDTAKNDLYWFLCKESTQSIYPDASRSLTDCVDLSQYEIHRPDLHFQQYNRYLRHARMRHVLRPPADRTRNLVVHNANGYTI
jgi:hypothetical protein